jgi:hypothetical protein
VLILLPPSESKADVVRGKPLDLDGLSFPELAATRAAVLDGLIAVSGGPDAMTRLGVPKTLVEVVARNVHLRSLPTAPAERVYTGVLYDALAAGDLEGAARRRARSRIVVISALWGAVRLGDRIPPYRLNMCGRLPGLGHLPQVWQGPLGEVLPALARRDVIVDCRSSDYVTAWRPNGDLAERTVTVKIVRERDGQRSAVSHSAKHTRGLVARRLVLDAADPRRPEELAEALAPHFDVVLLAPARPGKPWELQVVEPAPPT